jgi:hypothetical protein
MEFEIWKNKISSENFQSDPRLDHVGFLTGRVTMRQVFFKYFSLPCQFSFYQLLHIHHHLIIDAVQSIY